MNRLLTAVAVLSLLLLPSTAAGQEEQPAVLLIMDASGSMGRTDDAGVRLMDGAKDALTALVSNLPEGTPIGLRVYGHRVPNTDKANGCQDSELVVPVGPLDRNQMLSAIGSFDSRGFTPIGLSLQEAAADLDGFGTIVLVSDGEDTCAPPDPCDVAADLIDQGFNLRVQTVGFFLDDEPARQQLRCIADATGGTYREVTDLPRLVTELGSIVVEAVPVEGNFHLPIVGGTSPENATPVPWTEDDNDWQNLVGFFESPIPAGETTWFSTEVTGGRGLGVFGGHLGGIDLVEGETIEILVLGPDMEDALRPGPRRGVTVVDLFEAGPAMFEGKGPGMGASTGTDFQRWDELDPSEVVNLEAQGYDEVSYNTEWLEIALGRREAPIPDGTYYVGLAWDSDREGEEIQFGWGGGITTHPAELYGQDCLPIAGGPTQVDAAQLPPPAEPFDAYNLPPGEYPLYRWFYTVTLQPGEAQWFHQPLEFDEATEVEARIATPDAVGSLRLGLRNSDGDPIGRNTDHASRIEVPVRLRAGTSMVYDGEGDLPPSSDQGSWLWISWEGDGPVEVDLIVDVVERYPGMTPPQPPNEAGEPIVFSQPDQESEQTPTDDGTPWVVPIVSGAGLALLVSVGAWWWRRRHA